MKAVSVSSLEKSILATVQYSDYFNYPLKTNEISKRLISHNLKKIDNLELALRKLVKKKLLEEVQAYYCLPGRSNIVNLRKTRATHSQSLYNKLPNLIKPLIKLRNVLAIYVTGSLAANNAKANDDIDLMLIVKNDSLWITRVAITLYYDLFGLRRRPHSVSYSGKLCINLFLTPRAFTIPISKRSLYTAYELVQAVPIYDPYNTQIDLMFANTWINNYLPNFIANTNSQGTKKIQYQKVSIILKLLDPIAFFLQKLHMYSKITNEYVTKNCAFFHPNNPSDKILKKLSV